MTQVIITGSEGLIGNAVSKYLDDNGFQITRCDLQLGDDLFGEI